MDRARGALTVRRYDRSLSLASNNHIPFRSVPLDGRYTCALAIRFMRLVSCTLPVRSGIQTSRFHARVIEREGTY